jgi:hypothetical protein
MENMWVDIVICDLNLLKCNTYYILIMFSSIPMINPEPWHMFITRNPDMTYFNNKPLQKQSKKILIDAMEKNMDVKNENKDAKILLRNKINDLKNKRVGKN